ncbi:branched-chain amino acid transport system II carrier protein [Laceyella tengchongensis]
MERLTKKECLWVSLMVFSLFFGAGNLIFPPFLGQTAGTQLWPALGGFIVSAVGLPILGVVAVAKSGGLQSLAKRVHPVFALVFTLLVYLAIGPLLGGFRATEG